MAVPWSAGRPGPQRVESTIRLDVLTAHCLPPATRIGQCRNTPKTTVRVLTVPAGRAPPRPILGFEEVDGSQRSWFFYCPAGTKENSPAILWVGFRPSKTSSLDRDERITLSALVSNVNLAQTRQLFCRPCGTNDFRRLCPSTTSAGLSSIVPPGQGRLQRSLNFSGIVQLGGSTRSISSAGSPLSSGTQTASELFSICNDQYSIFNFQCFS